MTNNESTRCAELPKLLDDGTNNNYSSWKNQTYYKLHEWGLWRYIEGLTLEPPVISTLHPTAAYHGLDNDSQVTTIHVWENKEEYRAVMAAAEPWHTGNELALGHIYNTLPDQSFYLLLGITLAKDT
jgi:hypothetical protein